MIIRDGRNVVHDLGPRRVFEPSMMKLVAATGSTGTGRWTNRQMTIVSENPLPRAYKPFELPVIKLDEPCAAVDCNNAIYTKRPNSAVFCSTKCRTRTAKRLQRERDASA